jgi:hypothetical protein
MEKAPENENLIDTEVGEVLAKEVLDYDSAIESIEDEELKNKIISLNEIENIEKKILGFTNLSLEARRKGMPEVASLLNRRAIFLDSENSEILDKKNEERVRKTIQMADYAYSSGNIREGMKEKAERDLEELKNKTAEIEGMKEKHSVAVKESTRKKIMSTLKTFFSL